MARRRPAILGRSRTGERPLLARSAAAVLERATAGDLLLRARSAGAALAQGRHRSGALGHSSEFFDFRAYEPGDALNRVDWRLFGRTDRLFVRRFHHETQLTVMLALDASASMAFAGLDPGANADALRPSKFRFAQEIGAALAYVGVRQGDRVGVAVGGMGVVDSAPGWPGLSGVIGALAGASPAEEGGSGSIFDAVRSAAASRSLAGGGLLVLLTDALDEPGELGVELAGLRSRSPRCDILLVQVLTPEELTLPPGASAEFRDPETGRRRSAEASEVGARYSQLVHEHIARVRAVAQRFGARVSLATTGQPVVDVVRRAAGL